ncbi:MAG TPA: hypothetical protein VMZ53_21530 [Kofleriaceae bacterium]|nr:hypothetical protein [Kofleriaceae bacterium]
MGRVLVLAFVLLACGGSPPPPPSPPAPAPSQLVQPAVANEMPATLAKHMTSHGWGPMHLQWHTERRWDQLPPAAVDYAKRQGWRRAERQEGSVGNGVEFLAMHRAMIELLADADPSEKAVLAGWTTPPTDPTDPADPLPNGATTAFDPDMAKALDRLAHHLDTFASEDELGLFIETWFRPTTDAPKTRAVDRTAGVHNYLHQRFQDPTSPIDLGNPSTNLMNPRFWRLHGWIDHVWAAYRAQKGLRDTDAAYQQLIGDAKAHMSMRAKAPLEAPPAELLDVVRP